MIRSNNRKMGPISYNYCKYVVGTWKRIVWRLLRFSQKHLLWSEIWSFREKLSGNKIAIDLSTDQKHNSPFFVTCLTIDAILWRRKFFYDLQINATCLKKHGICVYAHPWWAANPWPAVRPQGVRSGAIAGPRDTLHWGSTNPAAHTPLLKIHPTSVNFLIFMSSV